MRLFEIGKFCSLIYLLMNLISSVFWPLSELFVFENILFVPTFAFVVYITISNKWFSRKVFLLLCIVFLLLFIIEILNSQTLIIQHALYLLRWIKYAVLFVSAYYFYLLLKPRTSIFIFKGLFLIIASINVLIILNIFGSGEMLQFYFAPKETFVLSNFYEPGVFRLGGTMMNPNDNAIIFSVFLLFFTLHKEYKDYYFAFFAVLILLLTQSRTAIILIFAIALLLSVYKLSRSKISKKQLFIFLAAAVFFFGFLSILNLNNLNSIFSGAAFKSNSITIRIENFFEVINASPKVFYMGRGVVLDQIALFGRYLDSEITLVIAQFGIAGFTVWLFFVVTMIYFSLNKLVYSKLWMSLILLFFGTSLTNLSFFSTQLGVYFFIILAFAFKQKSKIIQK